MKKDDNKKKKEKGFGDDGVYWLSAISVILSFVAFGVSLVVLVIKLLG